MDPAVVKAFPSSNKTELPSSHNPSLSFHQQQLPSLEGNVTPKKSLDKTLERDKSILPTSAHASELTDSKERKTSPTSQGSPTLNGASWADEEIKSSSSSDVLRPEWAQMLHVNGEPGSVGSRFIPPAPSSTSFLGHPGMGLLVNTGVIHMTSDLVGTLHPHSHHTLTHPHHTTPKHTLLTTKRTLSSHEERSVAKDNSNIIIPMPLHPSAIHGYVAGANSNWSTPHQLSSSSYYHQQQQPHFTQHLHPSTMAAVTAVRGPPQTAPYSHTQPNHNNSSSNGLLRTPTCLPLHNSLHPFSTGGLLSCSSVGPHPPSHVVCYNCGKRGHLGSSCPGVTMDAENSSCKFCESCV